MGLKAARGKTRRTRRITSRRSGMRMRNRKMMMSMKMTMTRKKTRMTMRTKTKMIMKTRTRMRIKGRTRTEMMARTKRPLGPGRFGTLRLCRTFSTCRRGNERSRLLDSSRAQRRDASVPVSSLLAMQKLRLWSGKTSLRRRTARATTIARRRDGGFGVGLVGMDGRAARAMSSRPTCQRTSGCGGAERSVVSRRSYR